MGWLGSKKEKEKCWKTTNIPTKQKTEQKDDYQAKLRNGFVHATVSVLLHWQENCYSPRMPYYYVWLNNCLTELDKLNNNSFTKHNVAKIVLDNVDKDAILCQAIKSGANMPFVSFSGVVIDDALINDFLTNKYFTSIYDKLLLTFNNCKKLREQGLALQQKYSDSSNNTVDEKPKENYNDLPLKEKLQLMSQQAVKIHFNTAFKQVLESMLIEQAQSGSYVLQLNTDTMYWCNALSNQDKENSKVINNTLKLLFCLYGNDFQPFALSMNDSLHDAQMKQFATLLKVFAIKEKIALKTSDGTIELNWNPSLSLQDAVKLSNQLFQEEKLK